MAAEKVNIYKRKDYLDRPRLNTLFKEAIEYPLVVVCAGSGYGKSYAVHSFLEEYKAHTAWMQISELDNNPIRFWKNYTNHVSLVGSKTAAKLEEIGFPWTDEAFFKYNAIKYELAVLPGKHVRVYDDFHLIRNPDVLHFFDRVTNSSPSNMTIILISRTIPEVNLIGMIMRGKVFTIYEDVLCFTQDEIAKYWGQLRLSVAGVDVLNIYKDTQGWAFAVNVIGQSLSKNQRYERYALGAMKKNIFKFIETEISQTVSEPLMKFLLKISIIDHLAARIVKELAKHDDALIREMELLNAYIRYDYNMDTYMIHHLFRDFLRQKQEQILTDEERKEAYKVAAAWCNENGYHIDAFNYYEKSCDYDAIILKTVLLNVQLPYDMAKYVVDIFERMPDKVKSQNVLFPGMYIKLKLSLGLFEEVQTFAEQYVKDYELRTETLERNHALMTIYAYWGLLRMDMCTYTDVYDFDFYFKKMDEYYARNPFRIIGTYKLMPMTSRASVVGTNRAGAMEEYIRAIARSVPYLSHSLNGYNEGLEELVRGELCFNRMEFNDAEQYFKQSFVKARKSDQYVVQNRALVYLMHIDFTNGDFESATAKLKEMEEMLSEKDYGVRYTMYDIAYSFYQLVLELPEQISEWLKGDFSFYSHPSFLENYSNRVRIRYHYQTHQYVKLLTFIEKALKYPLILYDKIELKVLQALSFYHLKKRSEACNALTEAYRLAESNKVISIFVQYEKDMHKLIRTVLKDNSFPVPKMWLKDISNKSSAFAKRKAKLISEYRAANNLEKEIAMTKREIEILKDLSLGISRIEIATNRKITVNTVKKIINTICAKLYVTNLPEAIRTAVFRKII